MVFVAEALGGWLIGQVADAGRKRLGTWLLGSDQERALQQAATAAILATARQLRPGPATADDPQGADHLARVIDQVFQQAPTPTESLAEHPTLLQGLQAGAAARLAVLEDAQITGTGQSSAAVLGVSAASLRLTVAAVTCAAADGSTATSPERPAGGSCSHATNSPTSSSRASRQSRPRNPRKPQKSFRSWA